MRHEREKKETRQRFISFEKKHPPPTPPPKTPAPPPTPSIAPFIQKKKSESSFGIGGRKGLQVSGRQPEGGRFLRRTFAKEGGETNSLISSGREGGKGEKEKSRREERPASLSFYQDGEGKAGHGLKEDAPGSQCLGGEERLSLISKIKGGVAE